jgi:hypothetical protein
MERRILVTTPHMSVAAARIRSLTSHGWRLVEYTDDVSGLMHFVFGRGA